MSLQPLTVTPPSIPFLPLPTFHQHLAPCGWGQEERSGEEGRERVGWEW